MTGRSVGDLEFTITGDTTKLAGQVKRDLSGALRAAQALSGSSSSIFGNTLRTQVAAASKDINKLFSGGNSGFAQWDRDAKIFGNTIRTQMASAAKEINQATAPVEARFMGWNRDATIFGNTLRAQMASATRDITKTVSTGKAGFASWDGELQKVIGSTNNLTGSMGRLHSKIQNIPVAAVTSLASALGAATAATLGLEVAIATVGLKSASSLQNTALAIGSLKDQLKDISPDAAIDAMRDLSVKSGIELETITKMEQGFVSLGISGKGSLAVIETALSGAAASGNLTKASVQGIARALQQIGSKPLLQLEELNQIADQIPAASRIKIIRQIAKDTGDTFAEVQERFRLGTQQSGDAMEAVVKVIKGLDKDGTALERRLGTIGGAFDSLKQRAKLALGDVFNEEGGVGSQLAKTFNNLDVEGLAKKVAEPVQAALANIVPPLIESLPDIIEGLALAFEMMAPVVVASAKAIGEVAGLIVDHQTEIRAFATDLGSFAGGLMSMFKGLMPTLAVTLDGLRAVGDSLGSMGQILQWLEPLWRVLGTVMAVTMLPGKAVLDAISAVLNLLVGDIDGVTASLTNLGNKAIAVYNLLAKITPLNSVDPLGGQSAAITKRGTLDALKATKKVPKPDFELPSFSNVGAVNTAGKAAAAKAEATAKALATSMASLFKDLNKYAKDAGKQSLTTIQNNADRIVEDMKEAIQKASEAGNKAVGAALQKQLKRFREGNKQLVALAKNRDKVLDRLDAAKDALKSLKDESADFVKSVTDATNALGNVTTDTGGIRTTFIGIRRTMRNAIADTLQFKAALDQLRASGLNETSLRQIVDAGVAGGGLEAARAIAKRGTAGVTEINNLQGYLEEAGKDLASGLNTQFYAAGIQAANGLVVGLQSQEAALIKAMDGLADRLVSSIKKKLKIASPSGVFEDEVGAMLPEGAAKGIYKRMQVAERAASDLGRQTIINFGAAAVQVNGVEDPKAAERAGLLAGGAISDVMSRRHSRAALAGER